MQVGLFVFRLMTTVYILYSTKLDQLYKGQTSNLYNRLIHHNKGYEKFTSKDIPWKLHWYTEKEHRSQAINLESKLKNMGRKQTINFIIKHDEGVACPNDSDKAH